MPSLLSTFPWHVQHILRKGTISFSFPHGFTVYLFIQFNYLICSSIEKAEGEHSSLPSKEAQHSSTHQMALAQQQGSGTQPQFAIRSCGL